MYPKEKINELKGNLKTAIQDWTEGKIDQLCKGKPQMQAASVYMKRGMNNWLAGKDELINSYVDDALLFIVDEKGCVDTDVLIEDFVGMFKAVDVQEADLGMFHVAYGKGSVVIDIPHNFFLDLIFGKTGHVTITADDLLELKELL